jgi:hypothetical protein
MWLLIRDLLLEHILTATATGGNEGQNCIATAQVTITQPEKIEPIITESICNRMGTLTVG